MSLSDQWLLPAIDASIAAAFFVMVAALIRFMRMRRGAPLNRVYAVLAAAIGLAGVAHASVLWSHLGGAGEAATGARALEAVAVLAAAGILLTLLSRSVDPPGRAALPGSTVETRRGFSMPESESQRLALQHQFVEAQKLEAVGRLAGGIAHDFNNMLLVIAGSASLLLSGRDESDPEWSDLKAIDDAADRASSLTRQLLAVARRQVFTVADVDLNGVVREMEDMLRRSLNDDVRFVLRLEREPLVVRADAGQLHQVLLNLAVNARDAMPQGGTLILSTRAARDRDGREIACVEVADTGVGMDAETMKHTFEPFFTTKGPAGTGLGLATVYGIVTQSGGSVDVASEPGKGSTFTVCLPRLHKAVEPPHPVPAVKAEGGSEVVLIVDDSEPVLALTTRILSRAGYIVVTAPSGHWALSVAQRRTEPIDLLITDVMMPGMSGPQLAERLAAARPDLRVLFMSGYQRTSDSGVSLVPEGARLIEKPFKPETLLTFVRAELDAERKTLQL